MPKALLEYDTSLKYPGSVDLSYTFEGFLNLDWDIEFTTRGAVLSHDITKLASYDCICGDTRFMPIVFGELERNHKLSLNRVYVPDYPDFGPLNEEAYCRSIKTSTLSSVLNSYRKNKEPVFMKPFLSKKWTGSVLNEDRAENLQYFLYEDDFEVYTSSLIDLVSEWRCYFLDGVVFDSRQYKGAWDLMPDFSHAQKFLSLWEDRPISGSIDLGLIRTSDSNSFKTCIVECHGGLSLGNYGIDSLDYVKMQIAAYNEILGRSFYHENFRVKS